MGKRNYIISNKSENPFSLSIGDLMAALLLIFVLLLAATLLRLQTEFDSKINIAETYKAIQDNLYKDLVNEFKDDTLKWKATIERTTLTIKFKEPDILFIKGQSALRPRFKEILSNFFPRYVKVLTSKNYKNNIEEIRIEGHTSSEWETKVSPEVAYINNMRLSQDRTRSVLEYVLYTISNNKNHDWVRSKITANGLSSSKLIYTATGEEDKKASRRVEFRIKTDAEQEIIKMLQIKNK